jgi:hypothetical protein
MIRKQEEKLTQKEKLLQTFKNAYLEEDKLIN